MSPADGVQLGGWIVVVWYMRDMIAVMRAMVERVARIESKIGIGPARIVRPADDWPAREIRARQPAGTDPAAAPVSTH